MAQQLRGPQRLQKRAIKIPCALASCKSGRDCQNVAAELSVPGKEVNRALCRQSLRRDCKLVKFCCAAHAKKAASRMPCKVRGAREGFTQEQFSFVFGALETLGFAWAAVLSLFQVLLGERIDMARSLVWGDLHHLDSEVENSAFVLVRSVNKKTKARSVPIPMYIARRLRSWMTEAPLGAGENTWPWPGQDLSSDKSPMFPGRIVKGARYGQRNWKRPVTRQGALSTLTEHLQPYVARDLSEAKSAKKAHVMEGVDIGRIGTHSMKKTSVMALADSCRSINVASAITGTSARTLSRTYDVPTPARKRKAIEMAFKNLLAPQDIQGQTSGLTFL
jgi:hypothetical protein